MTFENQTISESMVKLRAVVPENAFTAGILGEERVGNGIIIGPGVVLTIGYLIAEATDVWLTATDGHAVAGHPLAYDHVTGFGLVLPLEKLPAAPLALGSSVGLRVGDTAHVFSCPEFAAHQSVRIVALREFAGAWEYLLDAAIFTAPAHSHWSGAALIDENGLLVGVGSLLIRETAAGEESDANMFVPIDLLKPILPDLVSRGHAERPLRPWLGVYAVEVAGRVYVTAVAEAGPAQAADIRAGDLIEQVGDLDVSTLADFYRHLWSQGPAGVSVPLRIVRGGTHLHRLVHSIDRAERLKRPRAH